jgi:hypothetical protein
VRGEVLRAPVELKPKLGDFALPLLQELFEVRGERGAVGVTVGRRGESQGARGLGRRVRKEGAQARDGFVLGVELRPAGAQHLLQPAGCGRIPQG